MMKSIGALIKEYFSSEISWPLCKFGILNSSSQILKKKKKIQEIIKAPETFVVITALHLLINSVLPCFVAAEQATVVHAAGKIPLDLCYW